MDKNTIITDFDSLNARIHRNKVAMQELYDLCEEIKTFVRIQQETDILENKKRTLEPQYDAEIMSSCEHVFAETSYKHYEWENKNGSTNYNKYNLFVNHYCLKCGCSTLEIKPFYLEKYEITNTPTARVPHSTQIKIAEASSNYSIIDCIDIDFFEIIQLWKKIKGVFPNLSFEEQVAIFQSNIESTKINKKSKEKKVVLRRPTIYEYRHVPKTYKKD